MQRVLLHTLVLYTLLGTPSRAASQTTLDISGDPTCRGCRLDFTRIAILGSIDGESALAGEPTSVVQDSRGNYYVTQFQQADRILVFSGNGRFIRTIGKAGRGPGEYTRIAFITLGAGDSLYVFDQGNARLTVLSPAYDVVRAVPIMGQFFFATELGKNRFVANAHLPSPEHIGQPLRTMSTEGVVQAVYGASKPDYRPRVPYSVMRSIAAAGDTSVWSGYKTRYVIEEWSVNGQPGRILTRQVPWFKPYEQRTKATETQPLEPWLVALHQDRSGLLWAAVTVPATDWSKQWAELGINEQKGVVSDQRTLDTVVEVLDPTRRALVLSQRLPQYIQGFLNDSTAYGYSVDADEIPHIEIWRSRLIRGEIR
jgi:hypothetical protein